MKLNKNIIYICIIGVLTILLVLGYVINKNNSFSKKNEIRNLERQILTKNQQLSNIQRNLIENKGNINDLINPNHINFLVLCQKQLLRSLYYQGLLNH